MQSLQAERRNLILVSPWDGSDTHDRTLRRLVDGLLAHIPDETDLDVCRYSGAVQRSLHDDSDRESCVVPEAASKTPRMPNASSESTIDAPKEPELGA